MDCNNYSYTPYILDGEENVIERYENDDMEVEIWKEARKGRNIFIVSSLSYDGSLDVSEVFKTEKAARELYKIIYDNYISSPTDNKTLKAQIKKCHKIEKEINNE